MIELARSDCEATMTSPSHLVGAYLSDLHQSLGVGVPETSGYPALRNLLNAVGDTLKPKIAAVLHPTNTGAGLPDGGLFAARDLEKFTDDGPALETVKPERGVIEPGFPFWPSRING